MLCKTHKDSLSEKYSGKVSVWCEDCWCEVWIPRFPFEDNFTLDILQSDIDSGTVCSFERCPTAIAFTRKVLVDLCGFEFDEEGNFLGNPKFWSKMPNIEVEVNPEYITWKYGSDTWTILLPENLQLFIKEFDEPDADKGPAVGPIHVDFTPSCILHEWEIDNA